MDAHGVSVKYERKRLNLEFHGLNVIIKFLSKLFVAFVEIIRDALDLLFNCGQIHRWGGLVLEGLCEHILQLGLKNGHTFCGDRLMLMQPLKITAIDFKGATLV